MKNIQLNVLEDGVGVASMDMPGRPFNVFSEDMMDDLSELVTFAESNLKGLVITSTKSAFVAGADLGMIKEFADMRFFADKAAMKQRFSALGRIFRRLELLPIPVVAAVNGLALGGGLEVAMACHARVCVDTPAPILGLPEIQLGLLPGAGGTQRLPRYIGLSGAIKMLLDGNPLTPVQALESGLINAIAPADELLERSLELVRNMEAGALWDREDWQVPAADIATVTDHDWKSTALKLGGWSDRRHEWYSAVDAIIRCVGEGLPLDIDAGSEREWDIFVDLMCDPVVANMVVTCFLNKTAAPKRALQTLNKVAKVNACHWGSAVQVPKPLTRKVSLVGADEAEISVVDASALTTSAPANQMVLVDAGTDSAASIDSDVQWISFAGGLSQTEAVEVSTTDNDTTAKAISVVTSMQKIPVLVSGERSVLSAVSDRLTALLDNNEYSSAALGSVELNAMAKLVSSHLPTFGAASFTDEDRKQGLNLLAELSLEAYSCLVEGLINDPEMLDVLMVYGLSFPKWSGGPISFLAMLQRHEVEMAGLSLSVRERVEAIKTPLKDKAAYTDLEFSNRV